MDLRQVVKQRKLLLESGVLEKLAAMPQDEALEILLEAESKAEEKKQPVITLASVGEIVSEKNQGKKAGQAIVQVEKRQYAPSPARENGFVHSLEIPPFKKFDCDGTVEDFIAHFRNRFHKLSSILKNRVSAANGVISIEHAKGALERRKSRIIGMVGSKGVTKKGNLRFEIEDETGVMTCVAQQNKPAMEKAQELWLDDVVAVDGVYSQGLFLVENVVWPGVPMRQKKTVQVEGEASIAFLSDLHVGSKYFLEDRFEKALAFLNGTGSEEERRIAKTIRYVIIAGDVVDGVGVYPSQEKQLVTKNIFEQYSLLSQYLKKIPNDIQVVICPGNHDAVRDAEPQPTLPNEFVHELNQENIRFIPNPCLLRVHGLKILVYHGTSFDALVSNSQKLGDAFDHPEKVAVEILRRRHLCPTYGEKPIVPSPEDGMVVEEVPDIFHFGHVHKNASFDYNGTVIINSGTWQGETDYQKSMGRKPTPCLMPVYDIRTGALKILDFNDESESKRMKA
ncbi:MAG: DNA-directed DNA polymerase II small subunit [Candidatus Norongarragalinales archaeon]